MARTERRGADACTVRSFSAPILEGLLLERLRELVADESLVEAIMSRAKTEAEARAPQIREERDRLQGELRRFKEEAGRLVDAIATGTGGAELVAGRLQDAEDRLKTVETRLKELAAEEERLATAQVTPERVRASLARFSELWQTLPQTQKTRLVRLVVQEVVLDHRDRLRTKITWRLRPFRAEAAMDGHDVWFEDRRFQRPERNDLQTMETLCDFAMIDAFTSRSQGTGWAIGEPIPTVPQPARVVADLALAHEIQAALDGVGARDAGADGGGGAAGGGGGSALGEGLTYREAGPLFGVSRTTIGRHVSLARLAPDIQKVVARLTTTTASEPIDRKKLEWVAEPVKWPEQRARFQKVMDEAFAAEPAPIARTLAHAIKLRDDIQAKRITMKRVAAAPEMTVEELREYLGLAKLAQVVRDQVLGMTTVTANELVTEEKLRFIARERNHVEQRRMYERLLAGQLRCTREKARPEAVAAEQETRCPTPAPAEPGQTPSPMVVPSIAALAVG